MSQLNLFSDYKAYQKKSETSKSAWESKKNKLTKREQVYELIKTQSSTNYEISDELNMPLSSVCARCRELQELNLVGDSGLRRKTKYGKDATVWTIK
tara:strand:- start:528 stop:818 length:291 start_codon:yes stop_codon:yes gene_type:complete